jgi:hypothetical protein
MQHVALRHDGMHYLRSISSCLRLSQAGSSPIRPLGKRSTSMSDMSESPQIPAEALESTNHRGPCKGQRVCG